MIEEFVNNFINTEVMGSVSVNYIEDMNNTLKVLRYVETLSEATEINIKNICDLLNEYSCKITLHGSKHLTGYGTGHGLPIACCLAIVDLFRKGVK